MWFFKLGAFLFVLGLVMAPLMRGKKAFSREPKEPLIQVDDGKCGGVNTEASAPIPYVMLQLELADQISGRVEVLRVARADAEIEELNAAIQK
eukprot:CAMPEP_0169359452 /NCGR_PEP_ID=MMETSP1017-20121227/29229_1 /TAXON_ID=342587 /ORGANISM="Karlodinium micrum, Strain CCMP2283" /LENGTH=92 /DNA_ID=CAMNT_0009456599 /DNA_START=235 /DNA_END=511 /DNA_ORIENTATION=+